MIPGEDSETRTPDLLVEGTVEEAEKDVVAAATEEEVSPTMIDALEPEQEKEREDVSLSFLCYRDWLEGQIHDLSPAAATEFYLAEQVRLQEHQQDADVVFDDRYWTYLDDKIKQTSAAAQVLRAAFGDDDPPDDYDPSRYRHDNDDTLFLRKVLVRMVFPLWMALVLLRSVCRLRAVPVRVRKGVMILLLSPIIRNG